MRIRDGVLEVKSPRQMVSYAGLEPSPVASDGWIVTGDQVQVRGDRVFFLGRATSVISVGGSKVLPEEIEGAMLEVPGVREVCAYGVPNPITRFFVGADVVLAPGQEAGTAEMRILDHCRATLAAYKIPRKIRFVDSLEMSEAGKKRRTN